jgi:hypothetical protein
MMSKLNEKSPEGWGGTVSAMFKHHPEIKNPWALAYFHKNKGHKPHYKHDPMGSKSKKEPQKKEKYKNEKKHKSFHEWLEERESNQTH